MRYKVEFELVLDDEDPSEPTWVLDGVYRMLDSNELVENFKVELIN